MTKKFFPHVKRVFMKDATCAEKTLVVKVLTALIKAQLLNINQEELRLAMQPPAPSKISKDDAKILMDMLMRMLIFELSRLNDADATDAPANQQVLDLGTGTIYTDFSIPKRKHAGIERTCMKEGWKVMKIQGMKITLQRQESA